MKEISIEGQIAIVDFDEDEKLYTIFSKEKSGAIITHENFDQAKNEWIRGMQLVNALKKMKKYSQMYKVRNMN